MAQIFWEQIRNELPEVGEFLTGSLHLSGSFSTSGSLNIDLDGIDDIFKVSLAGSEKFKINTQGVVQLSQSLTPTAVKGGIFYSSSNDYFFGF